VPLKEDEAFVLRSFPLGESDRVVTFLTRGVGKVRGVAKGARRSRRRFGSNLELLSRVRVSYFEKEGVDLARIDSAELLESFFRLQEDPERGAVLACFAEVADAFAKEQQEDAHFFRLLHAVLRAVRDGLELDWSARYFELWTLRLHGVLPDLLECAECHAPLARRGGFFRRGEGSMACGRCGDPRHGGSVALSASAIATAGLIQRSAPDALIGRAVDSSTLGPLAALAQVLFHDHTERRFRSYEVLRSIRG
jgi:DNA repair protein RecO (recombination protein O)